MIKLKKVILLLVAILLLAFFTGCTEEFMGNDDDDDDTSDDGNESEEIYRTVTNAMNKAIIAVYLIMNDPANNSNSGLVELPEGITVNSDCNGTADVTGSYEIIIGETILYHVDLDITINSFCFNGTVVDGTADLTADMEVTIDDFEYSINFTGTGTLLGEASTAISWDITFIQDSSDAGTVSGYIIIDEVTYNISESITIGVI
jgi:hypothetical protein